jgi:hypothetical protein
VLARGLGPARRPGLVVRVVLLVGDGLCLATAEATRCGRPPADAGRLLVAGASSLPGAEPAAWLPSGWLALVSVGALLAAFILARG